MTYPKMIIFDYGHTLLYEPGWDSMRGNAELLKHATVNKNNCTVQELQRGADMVFSEHIERIRELGYDVSALVGDRFLYEYLGLEFSLSPHEIETVFWDACTAGAVMPGADKMLDYINCHNIRSAVISNIGWSGQALTKRINRLLPNNQFEFVIASSDYLFRKPSRYLFELALIKAELSPSEVWYCGDNPQADVEGASQVGIFPIWYDNATEKNHKDRSNKAAPKCKHLHIQEWEEVLELLESLQ